MLVTSEILTGFGWGMIMIFGTEPHIFFDVGTYLEGLNPPQLPTRTAENSPKNVLCNGIETLKEQEQEKSFGISIHDTYVYI